MAFRFRRRVKILPGVHVNLSLSGASLSVGPHGFTTNFSTRGVKTTVGAPGTGLSYQHCWSQLSNDPEQLQEVVAMVVNDWRRQIVVKQREQYFSERIPADFQSTTEAPLFETVDLLRSRVAKETLIRLRRDEPVPFMFHLVGFAIAGVVSVLAFAVSLVLAISVFLILSGMSFFCIRLLWNSQEGKRFEQKERERLKFALEKRGVDMQHANRRHAEDVFVEKEEFDRKELLRITHLNHLIDGEKATVVNAIDSMIENLDFSFHSSCDVFISKSGRLAFFDLDLPEIEDAIPKIGGVPALNRNDNYLKLVSGLVSLVAVNGLSFAPSLERVTIAAYTQRGADFKDVYVICVSIPRICLDTPEIWNVDPVDFLSHFNANFKLGSNKRLLKIDAPRWDNFV